jgi:hypothetical protein
LTGSVSSIEAKRMLDLYASAGATRLDVTWTTDWQHEGDASWAAIKKKKLRFRRGVSLHDFAEALPRILDAAERRRHNVIIRPDGDDRTFIQLDDLTADKLPRIAPPVLLILQTSPASFQAWLALQGGEDREFTRRLKDGTGADVNATGATRIAGSLNFKPEHAPDFPSVAIHVGQPGRMTSAAELEQLGLVAAKRPEPPPYRPPAPLYRSKMPSYAICLDRAPLAPSGDGPDRSKADLSFAMTAFQWGNDPRDIERALMDEPESKSHQRGEKFAQELVRTAVRFVRENQQHRGRRSLG